jgi:hypothetical protein
MTEARAAVGEVNQPIDRSAIVTRATVVTMWSVNYCSP